MKVRHLIRSRGLTSPAGPLAHATRWGDIVFVSGQTGKDPATGELRPGVEAQAEQALRNIVTILGDAGTDVDRIIKTTVFVTSHAAIAAVNGVYRRFFGEAAPARSCVVVAALPRPGAEIEIECVAGI